ncbi:single-stranded DNA-binding protein [Lacticaseibacillus sharpeae]|uniref:single-stranded DNA-binding protein n=1 Tax=Lacticaseibacillus sharpeae TaxID=1626 RepID=UPI000AB49D77
MINQVALTGRLTRDIEVKYTQSGTAVGTFTLAVTRRFPNKQTGERESDFVNCVIWQKSAENLAKFTHKGSLIGVQGRIQTRTYDDKDGKRVYVTEVVVEDFALLESRSTSENGASAAQNAQPSVQARAGVIMPIGSRTSHSASRRQIHQHVQRLLTHLQVTSSWTSVMMTCRSRGVQHGS